MAGIHAGNQRIDGPHYSASPPQILVDRFLLLLFFLGRFIILGIGHMWQRIALIQPAAQVNGSAALAAKRQGRASVRFKLGFAGGTTHHVRAVDTKPTSVRLWPSEDPNRLSFLLRFCLFLRLAWLVRGFSFRLLRALALWFVFLSGRLIGLAAVIGLVKAGSFEHYRRARAEETAQFGLLALRAPSQGGFRD